MAITAADVMKLRKMTSAGMMDCKKALEEAEGDFDKAIGIIRGKGKLVAAKRADRETSEGAVKARIAGGKGILVALGCETDFVSRNSDFQNLAEAIADVAIANCPADIEALKACKMADGYTVEEAVAAQTGKTGEKHTLAFYTLVEAPFVAEYIHKINGKLGALVGFNKEIPADLAKGIVMQVASMNPSYISRNYMPQEVVDHEREVQVALLEKDEKLASKPEKVKAGIIEGRISKSLQDMCLVDQEYFLDSDQKCGQYLKANGAEVVKFVKYVVGEGIEKKDDNFAAEVAAMVK